MADSPTTAELPVGSPEDILRRAAAVPERTGFPTVDQLTAAVEDLRARSGGLIQARRIGSSRLREPISRYTIGTGSRAILIVGGVHPNEPIGSWTVLHLLEQLLKDDRLREGLDATWHIVPCVDPDGMRLNEGWFADPTDRTRYARDFYRPAPDEQVEWTFPFSYKDAYFDAMLPETHALARAIDEAQPDVYVALHNSEAGGVYYYVSDDAPELYDLLHRIPEHLGVKLQRGMPEGAHYRELAPAIFEMGTLEDAYEFIEGLGLDPYPPGSAGDASSSYARRYQTFSLIAELPFWSSPETDDTTVLDESYTALLRETGAALVESGTMLVGMLERASSHVRLDTPFLRAARIFAPMIVSEGEGSLARAAHEDGDRRATVAERHSARDVVHMYRLRFGGMLRRALEAEVSAGTAPAPLRRLADEMDSLFARWCTEAVADDTSAALPIATLVGVQFGAILSAATAVGPRAR